MERLRERFAELEPAERAATSDDYVVMDVRGTLGGEEVEQLTRSDYLHRIGSGEFGSVLDGSCPPEARRHHRVRSGPRRLGAGRVSEPIHLRVLVKEVKAKKLPR